MREMTQAEFREMYGKITRFQHENRQTFEDYKRRFILSLYLLPPFGQGLSASEISNQYGFSHGSIKSAVDLICPENWRCQSSACKTDRFRQNKKRLWKDPNSGYNKSDSMRHKRKQKRVQYKESVK